VIKGGLTGRLDALRGSRPAQFNEFIQRAGKHFDHWIEVASTTPRLKS
jgi:hypothetical protein